MSATDPSRPSTRFRPRVERLEPRDVPAGNVTAFVQGGVLVVVGDDLANGVIVSRAGDRSAVVRPLEGTTLNGQTGGQRFGDLTRGYDLRLNGGDDVALVDGVKAHRTLRVDMGAGDDELTLLNVQSRRDTLVLTGAGNDSLTITGSDLKRRTAIDLGAGDDRLSVGRTKFGRDTFIVGGADTDSRGIVNSQFNTRTQLTGFETAFAALLPKAQTDLATVTGGQSVTIAAAANDLAGTGTLDLGSLTVVSQPTSGTVVANANGTFTYTSTGTAAGADGFTYTIRNAAGGTSNAAAVTIGITAGATTPPPPPPTPTPTAPTATDDAVTLTAGQSVTVVATANDTPGTASTLDLGSLAVTTQPTNGTVVANANGTFTYTSTTSAAGFDTFQYTVRNAANLTSNVATVTVTATAGPDTTAPLPVVTTTVTNPTEGVPARFVVTFSEDVTGFDASDLTVSNGTVSNFVALNGFEYTFDVTPGSRVPTAVTIAAGAAQDAAGNNSTAANPVVLPSLNDPSWQTLASGVRIWDVEVGTGAVVPAGSAVASVFYTGWLAANGFVFDSRLSPASPIPFNLPSGVIQGFAQGLVGMQVGGIRRIFIPSALGYGGNTQNGIPANSDLVFEVELDSLS